MTIRRNAIYSARDTSSLRSKVIHMEKEAFSDAALCGTINWKNKQGSFISDDWNDVTCERCRKILNKGG